MFFNLRYLPLSRSYVVFTVCLSLFSSAASGMQYIPVQNIDEIDEAEGLNRPLMAEGSNDLAYSKKVIFVLWQAGATAVGVYSISSYSLLFMKLKEANALLMSLGFDDSFKKKLDSLTEAELVTLSFESIRTLLNLLTLSSFGVESLRKSGAISSAINLFIAGPLLIPAFQHHHAFQEIHSLFSKAIKQGSFRNTSRPGSLEEASRVMDRVKERDELSLGTSISVSVINALPLLVGFAWFVYHSDCVTRFRHHRQSLSLDVPSMAGIELTEMKSDHP